MVWWHVYLTSGLHRKPSQWQTEPSRAVSWLHCSFVSSSLQCSKMPSGTAAVVLWSDLEAAVVSSISSAKKLGLRSLYCFCANYSLQMTVHWLLTLKFCYLGGFLSQNACIDDEITSRISKASASFGRLHHRLWSDRGIRLSTKIGVYRTVVLTTLLYGSESWTWYRRHVKKLDQFHLRCLRKICGISWKDRIPNTTVLKRCEIEGIEAVLIKGQLRWAGHLTRMEENRIPKALFYGELVGGQRSRGGQHNLGETSS